MPDFTFTSPDGKNYTVSGPDGATKEQAFAQLQAGLKSGSIKTDKAPAEPPPAPPEQPGVGQQLADFGKDIVAPVARGAGTAYGAVKNLVTGDSANPRESGQALVDTLHLSHPGDDEPLVRRAIGMTPLGQASNAIGEAGAKTGAAVRSLGPAGETAADVAGAVGDVAGGALTLSGARPIGAAVHGAIDEGINAIRTPTAAQAGTLASNPKVPAMRAAGFKITGDDMRSAVNASDQDIMGTTSSTPQATDAIQRHNQAHATEGMTREAGLGNTAAIDDTQIALAKKQAGSVYDKVGTAIGTGRAPTPNLDADLQSSAARAANPKTQQAIADQVQFYRDHFAKIGFDGPDAVQSVRSLRDDATTRMKSDDPDAQVIGATNRAMANAIENEMMRQLPVQAQDLKAAFPAARQQLAKLHDLEAVNDGGQVNAAKVLQLKKQGVPLSGAANDVADAADVAPQSMSRAGGTPNTQLLAPTHSGLVRNVMNFGRDLAGKLPGLNPATEAYQEAHYGPTGKPAPAPAEPAPAPPLALQPPPGQVSRAPPVQGEIPLPAERSARDLAPPSFELAHPEGPAFESAQRPLVNPPERTNTRNPMDRAEWDRAVLDTINRYRGELTARDESGAALGPNPPGSTVQKPRPLSPAQALRRRLGEAMQ